MKVGPFDTDRSVLVVAEIGNNHEGDFSLAQEMVRRAAGCGVGAVKFQSVRAADLVRRSETARFERLRKFELSEDQFASLSKLARDLGLAFISTPLSLPAARFLEPMVDVYKIASGDNDFFPLVEEVGRTGKPVIISTGVSDVAKIEGAVRSLGMLWRSLGIRGEFALLHCVSAYPTPLDQANLRAIPFLGQRFACPVGYSDHTLGIDAAVLAVAAGARIIEKHFTIDKQHSDFRDHQLSADPPEMADLVRKIRETEVLLGDFGKRVQPCEAASQTAIRRSIVAARDLQAGTAIDAAALKWIRPGDALRPGSEADLLGRTLKRDIREDDAIRPDDVE